MTQWVRCSTRDAGPRLPRNLTIGRAHARMERRELARQRLWRFAHDGPDGPQRVVRPDPQLQIYMEHSKPDRLSVHRLPAL